MKRILQAKKVKQTIAATTILLASVFSGQVSAFGQGFSSYESSVEYLWAYDMYGNMVERRVRVRVCN